MDKAARIAMIGGIAALCLALWLSLIGGWPHAAQAASLAGTVPVTTTIQAAIDAAHDGDVVSIPSGTYTESLTVNKALTLTGVSSATTIIQAVSGQRVITVTAGHNLRLENLTVTGGRATGDSGGGVHAAGGNLQIVNCRIADNSAEWGGGVFQEGSTGRVDVTGSWIELNTSVAQGGGIFARGSAALTNTLVLSNTAGLYGGGLHVQDGRVDLNGGLFSNNRALGDNGGGVNGNNSISIAGTQFISNTSNNNGGALLQWNAGYTVTVTNARFERNTAKNYGGGASVAGALTISNSTFVTNTVDSGNTSNTYGGGVYAGGASRILASMFVSNSTRCISCTYMYGGGLYTLQPTTIQDSTFDRNYSWMGGGAFVSSTLTISNSTFVSNTVDSGSDANTFGGGLYAGGDSHISDATFVGNSAFCIYGGSCGNADGGGLYSSNSNSALTNVVFKSNRAGRLGGGMGSTSNNLALNNVVFSGNQAGWGGGMDHSKGNLVLTNALFSGNMASWGGGMVIDHDIVTLTHVTLAGNRGFNYGGGIYNLVVSPTLVNCILWGNTAPTGPQIHNEYGGAPAITYSDIQGTSVYTGAGNINADPRFIAPITATAAPTTSGNYHLRADSPAINAGTNAGVVADMDGELRDAAPDMGMDEVRTCWARLNNTSTDYGSVQAAVDASAPPADVVKVAGYCPGVQVRSGMTQTVYLGKTITVRGGYTTTNWTTSNPVANATTLDALGRGRVFYVTGNVTPTLEGLRLTNGLIASDGGGLYADNAHPIISGCLVYSNTAIAGNGGGLLILNGSGAILTGNQIYSNTSANDGGGVSLLTSSNARLTGNQIYGNSTYFGGGVYAGGGSATLTGNEVHHNTAMYGGGVYLTNNSGTTLAANLIYSNTVTVYGGGVTLDGSNARLVNTVIAGNRAYGGSGLYISRSSPQLVQTTLARNVGSSGLFVANSGPSYSTVAMTNTILISHTVGITVTAGNTATLNGVLWFSNTTNYGGAGNIAVTSDLTGTPAFAADGYHLTSASMAIDRGVNSGVTTDIDGDLRPMGKSYDLGADEFREYNIYLPLVIRQ